MPLRVYAPLAPLNVSNSGPNRPLARWSSFSMFSNRFECASNSLVRQTSNLPRVRLWMLRMCPTEPRNARRRNGGFAQSHHLL